MKSLLWAIAFSVLWSTPAYAYDPEARRARSAEPRREAPATPVQIPPGLYRVTEVYRGDLVTRSGELTSYATLTEPRVTDTFARVLATVATGERSAFDGRAFNRRASLSSGELLAGTYYQNFVPSGGRFVPVSVVFFQDDSELARRRAAATPAPPAPAPPSGAPTRPAPAEGTAPERGAPVPDRARDNVRDSERESSASPSASPPPSRPPLAVASPSPSSVEIGVDPTGGAAVLRSLEVARAAPYALRVNARGTTAAVVLEAWRLLGGVNDAANAPGWHGAGERLAGSWSGLPAPGQAWSLLLRVRLRAAGGGPAFERDSSVAIWVRSPAVVE